MMRLIFLVMGLLLAFGVKSETIPATATQVELLRNQTFGCQCAETNLDACCKNCQAMVNAMGHNNFTIEDIRYRHWIPYLCHSPGWGAADIPYLNQRTTVYTCPTGYTLDPGGTTCTSNAPACPASGTVAATGLFDWGTDHNTAHNTYRSVCKDGCLVTFDGKIAKQGLVLGAMHYYALGSYIHLSSECTAGQQTPAIPPHHTTPPQETCGLNQVQIVSTSGVTNCYNNDGTKANPNKPSAVNVATGTDEQIKADAVAAGEAAAEAVAEAGGDEAAQAKAKQEAITNTITHAIQQRSPSPSAEFCEANPTAPACAGFNTDKLNKEETQTQIKDLLQQIAESGVPSTLDWSTDGLPDDDFDRETKSVAGAFTGITFGGNATCPAPLTLQLSSGVKEINFQPFCDFFSVVRPIVLAVSALIGLYIVMGFKQGE